jgi:hypothetical protein
MDGVDEEKTIPITRRDTQAGVNQGIDHADEGRISTSSMVRLEDKRYLACPFFKYMPYQYRSGRMKSCQNGYVGMNRLKYHLKIVHAPDFYCYRCKTIFKDRDDRNTHDVLSNHVYVVTMLTSILSSSLLMHDEIV